MTSTDIAKVCHAANAAYCQTLGDNSQKSWEKADHWQRESAIKGVQFKQDNPEAPASAQHEAWLKDKREDGWKWGPVKDAKAKEHPCFVSYAALPLEQQRKDALFQAIVKALSSI